MSRRRVSVKDLGQVDCQGWLQRRRESRSFLSSRWKRYWFILKKSSLYWYKDKTAEKAEGFIKVSGFTVSPATQCRKKHAIEASHPQVVTIFIAAENFTDMNRWISKLSEAAETSELINTEECYSEGSDQDGDECLSTSCLLDPGQEMAKNVEDLAESTPETPIGDHRRRRRSTSEGGALCRNRQRNIRRRSSSVPEEQLSWVDLPGSDRGGGAGGRGDAVPVPLIHVVDRGEGGGEEEEVIQVKPPDEMETLYTHLQEASLSLIGRPGHRDFRASFVRRCEDHRVNEKLHLLRILRSTLKAKELDLQAVEKILTDPSLTATSYREWRLANSLLLQDISRHRQEEAEGGAAELRSTQ